MKILWATYIDCYVKLMLLVIVLTGLMAKVSRVLTNFKIAFKTYHSLTLAKGNSLCVFEKAFLKVS